MRVSAVIPAYNEAASIVAVIEAVRAAGADEVVVVCDSCSDGTAALAGQAGATVLEVATRNVAANRNLGAAAAVGDVLLFIDADTLVSANLIDELRAAVERGATYGGARLVRHGPGQPVADLRIAAMNACSRWLGLYYGSVTFCTAAAFHACGRYDEQIGWGEDVDLTVRLRPRGRQAFLQRATVVYCDRKFIARGYLVETWQRHLNGLGYLRRLVALARDGRLLQR